MFVVRFVSRSGMFICGVVLIFFALAIFLSYGRILLALGGTFLATFYAVLVTFGTQVAGSNATYGVSDAVRLFRAIWCKF